MQFRDRLAVFTVWDDVFIHVREISAFAHAHGLASIPDIKMAGASAPVYHFASYMVPAALNAVTSTSAIDAYCAFQLPFGILLIGLAAFSLISIFWKAWPALIAAAAVVSLPDAYQQGFGIRLLSFHFMTQVNLGIFYGIACISVAWIFMIEGCRRARLVAVGIAYVFLAVCSTYKAHLFVANAFILLLYPCFLFPGLRRRWRLLAAVSLTAIFVTVVWISQMSPRVPTLRLDGSGIAQYVRILMDGFDAGVIRDTFRALYVEHHYPRLVNAIIVTSLIVISSFGFWTLVAPFVFWRLRRNMPRRILWFPALIVINYLVMAHFLALDERGIGTAEEFVNRPIVWAYFVLVAFAAAGIYVLAFRDTAPRQNAARWGLSILACLALFGVYLESRQLQTYPGWKGYGDYAEFNSAPLCLVRAAQYIRDNGRYDEVMQDSRYDPSFVATALSERQAFAVGATSAGRIGRLRERLDAVARIQSAADGGGLQRFAETNRIAWYLMHPEDSARWDDRFLDRAAYQCDGYRVFRLAR